MKKIILLLTVFSMVFTSCDPLEDIYSELDSQKENGILGDVTYKFTDEDYTTEKSKGGFFGFQNEYFSSIGDLESMVPAFLSDKFPALGVTWKDGKIEKASSVIVTYNLKSPIQMETYTVTDADYTTLGKPSLNSNADFNAVLSTKYPGVNAGTIVELTYKKNPEITDYTLTDADYDLVGNGRFDNFDIRTGKADETIEARRFKVETILINNFPNASLETKYKVSYKAFNGTATETLELDVVLRKRPGIVDYTLTEDDFDLVGNGRFDNFDIRAGKPEETIESRRAKIETILLKNFPSAVSGDLYNVTYKVWTGQDETRTTLVEFDGTNYKLFNGQSLTYELYTFAFEDATKRFAFNNTWDAPKSFTEADYTAMGQRFPNFSNAETAVHRIGIYLKTLYPFALKDMFLPVEYDLFRVGKSNVNFVFDGTNWNGIPEVIEKTAQFSHNSTTWEFDNTIKYTLTNGDYALVGNGNFNNFDVRGGKSEETVESRRVKINTILLNNFPQYGVGQKFSVSYAVWKPGNDVFVMNVIHDGTNYILQ